MAKPTWKLLLALLMLVLSGLACNFPGNAPRISEAWTARDYFGEQPAATFNPQDVFFCIARLESPIDESSVQAVWTIARSEEIDQAQIIDQAEISTRSGTLHFELSNAGPWPAGVYKVDLYLNGMLDRTLEFTVQ